MSDDLLLLLDGSSGQADTGPASPPPARAGRALVTVAAAALAIVAGIVLAAPHDTAPTDPSAGMEAPAEPAVDGAVAPLAVGWRSARLPGPGMVSTVAGGPLGWVAATDGGETPVVFTSPDAVLWSFRQLDGPGFTDPVSAVGDGAMVVAGTTGEGSAAMAVSTDGQAWVDGRVAGLRPAGADVVGADVYAYGEDEAGEAMLVWFDGSSWRPVGVDGATVIAGVVEGSSGPVAIGRDRSGMAAWVIRGEAARRSETGWPAEVGELIPMDVFRGPGGTWGMVVGDSATGPARWLLASPDLASWEMDGAVPPEAAGLVSVDERVVGWGEGIPLLSERTLGGWRPVGRSYRGTPTGVEDVRAVGAVAVWDEVVVIGGTSASGKPAIWTRGSSQPAAVAPTPGPDQPWWRPSASADTVPGTVLTGAARRDDEVFIGSSTYVWRLVRDDGGGYAVAPTLLAGTDRVVEAGGEVFALAPDAGRSATVVYRYHKDAMWEREHVPGRYVQAVSQSADGRIVAVVDTDDGPAAVQRSATGDWTEVAAADLGALGVTRLEAAPAGFIGRTPDGGAFSPDGVTWQADSRFSEPAAPGFGVVGRNPDSTGVLVFDAGWAGPPVAHVPTSDIRGVRAFDGRLWVQAPAELLIGEPGGSWERIPISIASGMTGSDWLPLAGEEPLIAMVDGRRLQVMAYRIE